MHKLKDNLLVKVILAIVLGISLGGIIPEAIGRIFMTFNDLLNELEGQMFENDPYWENEDSEDDDFI